MKINKLFWIKREDGISQAFIDCNNGYKLSIIKGGYSYSNNINTYEVALLYNGEISYELNDDVWKYQTEKDINNLIKRVKRLTKIDNKDVPDSTIIKILEQKINRLNNDYKILKSAKISEKVNKIINYYVDNLNLTSEEKEESKRNPYYLKCLENYSNLLERHKKVKESNKHYMDKCINQSKTIKKLIEIINKNGIDISDSFTGE